MHWKWIEPSIENSARCAKTDVKNAVNSDRDISVGSTVKADYTYDGLERMAIRMTPSTTTHYIYDRAGRLLAEATGTGTIQREYVWLDNMPLALFADLDTGSPKQWYVHPDHLDRPSKMTDASQTVVWDASYTTYGEVQSITHPAGAAFGVFAFKGAFPHII